MFKQQILLVATFLLCCTLAQSEIESKFRHPDVGLRVPELVTKYGYPLETYTVTTKDDYILTVHHIPHGKNNSNEKNKPVIFLMHGLLCSSADWVLMGPEKGLAYLLADLGYDVWMGNARGNTYSRKHVTLSPDNDKKKFWDFSWHEIGVHDIPAMIDFVLEKTQEKKIFYIGHSQGTTAYFVMQSTLPQYNEKIRLMVALAPVGYMGHAPNPALQIISRFKLLVGWIAKFLGQYEFLPSTNFIQDISAIVCDDQSILKGLCSNILFLIAGVDEEELDEVTVPVILSNTPAGSATRQLLHYAQEVTSKKFRQYDYGLLGNLKKYNQSSPPNYDISKITSPVAMFVGKNDLLVSIEDSGRLHEELKEHSVYYDIITYKDFSHLDFLWAKDVVSLLYERVFNILERY